MLLPWIIAICYIISLELTFRTLIYTKEILRLESGLFRAGAFIYSLLYMAPTCTIASIIIFIIALIMHICGASAHTIENIFGYAIFS